MYGIKKPRYAGLFAVRCAPGLEAVADTHGHAGAGFTAVLREFIVHDGRVDIGALGEEVVVAEGGCCAFSVASTRS